MTVLSDRGLWILVGVIAACDVLITLYGLQVGLSEGNPVARSAMDSWGAFGFIALKAVAIAVGIAAQPVLATSYRWIAPAALAVPWAAAVIVNIYMLSMVI